LWTWLFVSAVLENEFLFSTIKEFKQVKYIIVVESEKAKKTTNTGWEGKLIQLRKFIEESSEKHLEQLNDLQNDVETIGTISRPNRG